VWGPEWCCEGWTFRPEVPRGGNDHGEAARHHLLQLGIPRVVALRREQGRARARNPESDLSPGDAQELHIKDCNGQRAATQSSADPVNLL